MSYFSVPSDYQWKGYTTKMGEFGRTGFSQREFNYPWFMDCAPSGDIAIADTDNNRIQIFDSNQICCPLFPAYGKCGSGRGELRSPRSVCFFRPVPTVAFAVADTGNRRVVLLGMDYTSPNCPLYQCAEFGQQMFSQPSDVAADHATGRLYVTDTGNHRVTIHDKDGCYIGQCCVPAQFQAMYQPVGVTMDNQRRVLVTDMGNHAVRVFDANGGYLCTLGKAGKDYAQFNRPKGICVDRRGYIYVADEGNNRIQLFNSSLQFLSEIVRDVPVPKGVAAGKRLFVSTGDQCNFVKMYNT